MVIRSRPKIVRKERLLAKMIIPALAAALSVMALYLALYFLKSDFIHNSSSSLILFASFGSSAFLLFMAPHSRTAKLDRFVKSYVIGTIIGGISYFLIDIISPFILAGVMMFVMAMMLYATESEHPPAIGIMLAFVLYRVDLYGVMVVLFGVMMMVAMRVGLERYVYDADGKGTRG